NGLLLPVKLIDFTATSKPGGVELNWISAAEINSDYFGVEKSTDGVNFTEIGQVEAAGNSTVTTNYTFFDGQARDGDNFYRLKMVDNDLSYSYSIVVHIRFEYGIQTPQVTIKFLNRSMRS